MTLNNIYELFPEFYQEKLTHRDLLPSAENIIAVDTNYLLDILSLPYSVALEYIEALETVKQNLYIPYLVALEFNFNKSIVKSRRSQDINNYKQNIQKNLQDLKENTLKLELLNLKKNDENTSDVTNDLIELSERFEFEFNGLVTKTIDTHVTTNQNEIYERLLSVINNNIGNHYTQEWIDEIQLDGEIRFSKKIPPGFNDANKSTTTPTTNKTIQSELRCYSGIEYERQYADLIIWKDLLNYANSDELTKKKIIYVTNDGQSGTKNDLLFKRNGMTIGPQMFLMNEMSQKANKELYIISNVSFISQVKNLSDQESLRLEGEINDEPKFRIKIPNHLRESVEQDLLEKNLNSKNNFFFISDDGYLVQTPDFSTAATNFNDKNIYESVKNKKPSPIEFHIFNSLSESLQRFPFKEELSAELGYVISETNYNLLILYKINNNKLDNIQGCD